MGGGVGWGGGGCEGQNTVYSDLSGEICYRNNPIDSLYIYI